MKAGVPDLPYFDEHKLGVEDGEADSGSSTAVSTVTNTGSTTVGTGSGVSMWQKFKKMISSVNSDSESAVSKSDSQAAAEVQNQKTLTSAAGSIAATTKLLSIHDHDDSIGIEPDSEIDLAYAEEDLRGHRHKQSKSTLSLIHHKSVTDSATSSNSPHLNRILTPTQVLHFARRVGHSAHGSPYMKHIVYGGEKGDTPP